MFHLQASFNNRKNVIPLTEQIEQFSSVKNNLTALMGVVATEKFLSKSLIFISIGSNDLFGYYHSNSSIPKEEFLSSLELAYENHLKVIDILNSSYVKHIVLCVSLTTYI